MIRVISAYNTFAFDLNDFTSAYCYFYLWRIGLIVAGIFFGRIIIFFSINY